MGSNQTTSIKRINKTMKNFIKIAALSLLISMQSDIHCSSPSRSVEQVSLEASINENLLKVVTDMPTIISEPHGGFVTSQAMGALFSNSLFIPGLSPNSPNKESYQELNQLLLSRVQEVNGQKSPHPATREFYRNIAQSSNTMHK